MFKRASSHRFRHIISLFLGIAFGILLAGWLPLHHWGKTGLYHGTRCRAGNRTSEVRASNVTISQRSSPSKNLVFVGVMTTAKFLPTRAVAVNRTWAKTIPGRVEFFSSETSEVPAEWNLPVVSLQGVDDSYPPQKKSLMMLKYMYDNFIDRYEWFMRADDDLYVKSQRLEQFLRSINATERHFIGQPGIGEGTEEGALYLQEGENFCMGGTGIILSRETLESIAPNINYCLKNLWSTHEDVEVSRCVHKFADVDCTWSYEMRDLFYHNFSNDLAFTGDLHIPDVRKAITMHPVKQSSHMYRVHAYIESQLMTQKRLHALTYSREIGEIEALLQDDRSGVSETHKSKTEQPGLQPSLVEFKAESAREVLPWEFFNSRRYSTLGTPIGPIIRPMEAAIAEAGNQYMQVIRSKDQHEERTMKLKGIKSGYLRLTPHHGVDYMLDLSLTYEMGKASSRAPSVRRNTYLHQGFGRIEFIEDEHLFHGQEIGKTGGNSPPPAALNIEGVRYDNTSHQKSQETIYFVIPVAGRLEAFTKFLDNFERSLLAPGESVGLLFILFRSSSSHDPSEQIENALSKLKERYQNYDIRLLHGVGDFQRALALDLGASQFPGSALLFLVDVDMHVSRDFLSRCRENTQLGSQVYYPIVFSQYNPEFLHKPQLSPLMISKEAGFFRVFGYGMVCIYNTDLRRVGGMNSSIVGWGYEDVDLYDSVLSSNITIFRAPDPGLTHIYHSVECDNTLGQEKYNMCLGSKWSTYGSSLQLMKKLQEVQETLAEDVKELSG